MSGYEGSVQANHLPRLTIKFHLKRGTAFGIIILIALLAFELFNFSTTEYALGDMLGQLSFAGLRWATILSIAFCGIDFAGIARLFSPDQDGSGTNEVWYLFGAWLLAASMNAILTWWGVSMAMVDHQVQSTAVLDPGTAIKVVPVFVAVMVWLIRILIIGSLSYAGDQWFSSPNRTQTRGKIQPVFHTLAGTGSIAPRPQQGIATISRSAAKPAQQPGARFNGPEPTYHSLATNPGRISGTTGLREPASPDTRR